MALEILLIEDDPDDVELTLHALRKHKVANRIEVLRDGEAALDFLFRRGAYAGVPTEDQPRVILLDLKLPKLDGLEVLKAIRGDPRTAFLPVVILTSSREEKDILSSYSLGANSYIVKPVDFSQFAQAVTDVGLYWLLLNQPPRG